MKPTKLALIHAISGFGHSTMSVIHPIVSAMGIQGCPLPTALFSNHTGFPSWYKLDFTEHMQPYADAWNALHLTFDGIYSGYLGSGAQVDAVLHLVETHPEAVFFLDPVMGDHGRLYSAITDEHVAAMKKLTSYAQYLLPNITEACILTNTPYRENFTYEEICHILCKLHALGPKHIVITGILQENLLINYISEISDFCSDEGHHNIEPHIVSMPVAGASRPGTGDIFGAVVVSDILNGQPLEHGVRKAAQFVSECIQLSDAYNLPIKEGTCFELALPSLLRQE